MCFATRPFTQLQVWLPVRLSSHVEIYTIHLSDPLASPIRPLRPTGLRRQCSSILPAHVCAVLVPMPPAGVPRSEPMIRHIA